MITEEMIAILIAELKQQHEWRLEDSECGDCEIAESWDKVKYRVASKFNELGCTADLYNKILAT